MERKKHNTNKKHADDSLLQPMKLGPVALTPQQQDLCRRLDELYSMYDSHAKPSTMFKGALFAMRYECRTNPDWMAQVAHSLREILYHFGKNNMPKKEESFKQYGSITDSTERVGKILGRLTEVCHHGYEQSNYKLTEVDFEDFVSEFEQVMQDVLRRQVDVHATIDNIANNGPPKL